MDSYSNWRGKRWAWPQEAARISRGRRGVYSDREHTFLSEACAAGSIQTNPEISDVLLHLSQLKLHHYLYVIIIYMWLGDFIGWSCAVAAHGDGVVGVAVPENLRVWMGPTRDAHSQSASLLHFRTTSGTLTSPISICSPHFTYSTYYTAGSASCGVRQLSS